MSNLNLCSINGVGVGKCDLFLWVISKWLNSKHLLKYLHHLKMLTCPHVLVLLKSIWNQHFPYKPI